MKRRLGLLQATAINMNDMVGIGPFITLPLVMQIMGGPYFLWAWVAGAVLAIADSMVWAELGAAFPRAGGSYHFLKEAYGPQRLGKLMSFLFVWQTMIQAPLVIASAAIGFSAYLGFLIPLTPVTSKLASGSVVILIVILLYRKIESIGRLSILLWVGVLGLFVWIIFSGAGMGDFFSPVKEMNDGLKLNYLFAAALGAATVKTIYSFLGYYNVCHLGSEIKNPSRNIPLSMFISILAIAAAYLLLNISVSHIIPWNIAQRSKFVVSLYFEKVSGHFAAVLATCLVLWVAFSSVFSATLGYSRIPYAAARDGAFFSVFGKLHPTKDFPYVSLVTLGSIAFIFSLLFRLSDVISAILAMRILIQFIGQAVGLLILRHQRPKKDFPFKMPLFPFPVIIAILIWIVILISTGSLLIELTIVMMILGAGAYLWLAAKKKEWPFQLKIED